MKAMAGVMGTLTFILILLVSCSPQQLSGPAPTAAESRLPTAAPKESWQPEWEKLQSLAKTEGSLLIYGEQGAPVVNAIKQDFGTKYGINVDFYTGRTAEVAGKLLAERNARLYLVDVYMSGTPTAMEVLKPQGVLDPLEPILILPDVLDGKAWFEGKIPWVDKDRTQIAFLAVPMHDVAINTDLAKPAEINSYKDLLNPKWKRNFSLNDPSTGGAGASWFSAMAEGIMNLDFLRQVAKQEPIIIRDQRLQVEWVARGKYPLGIALSPQILSEFRTVGAPIKAIVPIEGTYVTQTTGAVSLINKAPHPNAAKLFINWLLSKEGNYPVAKAHGNHSARLDVPTDYLDEETLRQPGIKYFNAMGEDYARIKREHLKTAVEVFGTLIPK